MMVIVRGKTNTTPSRLPSPKKSARTEEETMRGEDSRRTMILRALVDERWHVRRDGGLKNPPRA